MGFFSIFNVGVEHGAWGERLAVKVLKSRGMEILDRNSRPCAKDRRLEIDIVAYESSTDTLVFVEVKQHSHRSPYQKRLRSVDKKKMMNMRRACWSWRHNNTWEGGFRFDVIEIYGEPGAGVPEVDYIENVNIFVKPERRVRWS